MRMMKMAMGGGHYIISNSEIPRIVLIIGESTQRHFFSLYDFPLPTNPQLQKLRDSRNLFIFTDIIAPHTHTISALSKVLTFSNYENATIPWYRQNNIVNLMKMLGYETIWLSNQEATAIWGNRYEAILRQADILRFTKIHESELFFTPVLDWQIFKLFADIMPSERQFIVFHLQGTHTTYSDRYPESFAQFSAESLARVGFGNFPNGEPLAPYQLEVRAHYANAVLYNDFIVSQIMESFKDSNAIVFYLSDHGDEVYDFRDFVGHTETLGSRFMVEIPFMIYVSDSFKNAYPATIQRIESALDKPQMSDDFIHSFIDILGIRVKDFEESRSIFSPRFNDKRARIFNGVDYDEEMKDSHRKK